MTEDRAEALVCSTVPRETADKLRRFIAALRNEATRQNLVSVASLETIWQRHILDCSQLLPLAPREGLWIDIGSGAGFPGIVAAILRHAPILLIEPRQKRAEFLQGLITDLDLAAHAYVSATSASSAPPAKAAVISARAVAGLEGLFAMGQRFATPDTVWVLPKGRSAADELAATRASWQGDFRLVPSQTDSSASIVVARGVRPR